jgi:hypothetical protein
MAAAAITGAMPEQGAQADPAPVSSEPRAAAPSPGPGLAAASGGAGADIARQIALRVAQAAEAGPGGARGTVELSLSPEELGRVRLRLHPSEAGLNVTIIAERPETLDLMRRNIDLLARDFLDIGYDGAQFDFAQGGQGAAFDHAAPPPGPAPEGGAPPAPRAPVAQAVALLLGDRLDIRL